MTGVGGGGTCSGGGWLVEAVIMLADAAVALVARGHVQRTISVKQTLHTDGAGCGGGAAVECGSEARSGDGAG